MIREERPGYVVKEHVDQVGLHIAWFLEDRIGVIVCCRRGRGRKGRMSGPLALMGFVHMPFFTGIVDGDVAACALCGQAR